MGQKGLKMNLKNFVKSAAVAVILLGFAGIAWAESSIEAQPVDALMQLVTAAKEGNWRLVAALGLGLSMLVFNKVRPRIKWLKGDRGGAVSVMAMSLAGAFSTALLTDAEMDLKLVVGAVGVAWTAAGGYTWMKRLLWPKD